jgi:hypothetical protein
VEEGDGRDGEWRGSESILLLVRPSKCPSPALPMAHSSSPQKVAQSMWYGRSGRYLFQHLSWVQGEGVLGQPDLLVSVAKPYLPCDVKEHCALGVPAHWVDYCAVVTWGDSHHAHGGEQHPVGG